MSEWEGLNPPYGTIVVDPPWPVRQPPRTFGVKNTGKNAPLPYQSMSIDEIVSLPIFELVDDYCHLYLWTVNCFVEDAYGIAKLWGFKPSALLTWCKTPHGIGPGREFAITTEFCLFARRGTKSARDPRVIDTTWWNWPRRRHSEKPDEFFQMVRDTSPGPHVELFARKVRPGWSGWGDEYEGMSMGVGPQGKTGGIS